jgi:PTH1 family peptidyl-tRNA hydrolase
MKSYIVGIGNKGKEYDGTRHNIGRTIVDAYADSISAEFSYNKTVDALVAKDSDVTLILPETFVNKSGYSVGKIVKSKKAAEMLLVVRDDLDMPLGTMKMTFGRGSGGHKGVESIARAIKTKDFAQLKIGISPSTPKGKLKKVSGEEKVAKFVLARFAPSDQTVLKKVSKKAQEAIRMFVEEGVEKAQMFANTQ